MIWICAEPEVTASSQLQVLGALLIAAVSLQVDVMSTLPEATALVCYVSFSVLILFSQGLAVVSSSLVQAYYAPRLGYETVTWRVHAIWGSLAAFWFLAVAFFAFDAGRQVKGRRLHRTKEIFGYFNRSSRNLVNRPLVVVPPS